MSYTNFYNHFELLGLQEKGQAGSAITGTIAAGLAANAVIWTVRYPEAATKRLFVGRLDVVVTTLVGFTVSLTAGRALKLVRGTAPAATADPSGGAAWTPARKRSDLTDETLGVGRIATTAALTTTGFTFESQPIRRLPLTGAGAAGAVAAASWVFDGQQAAPIILLPGQALAIAAGQLFDALGTFELTVDVDAAEA